MSSSQSADRAHFEQASPLESLVRRASSRRVAPHAHRPTDLNTSSPDYDESEHQSPFTTPPKQKYAGRPPSSPLLHTQFRGSTATALTGFDTSYADTTGSSTGYDYAGPVRESAYHDDESVYSRQSYASHGLPPQQPPSGSRRPNVYSQFSEYNVDNFSAQYRDSYEMPPGPGAAGEPAEPYVPTVVVSAPSDAFGSQRESPPRTSTSSTPARPNYSRPLRPAASSESIRPPLPPTATTESKRQVLERNANRRPSQTFTRNPSAPNSPATSYMTNAPNTPPSSLAAYGQSPASASSRSLSPGLPPPSPQARSGPNSRSTSPDPGHGTPGTSGSQTVTLPNRPPSPSSGSPTSLYSRYSYYDLDKANSPTNEQRGRQQSGMLEPGAYHSSKTHLPSPLSSPTEPTEHKEGPEDYLQLGIQHHEANRLQESARYFEMSAKEQGGCGVGMLMWGLTLRSGWGVKKDEKKAFKWIKRAAESAVGDLESTRGGMEATAVKSELILAIYEVAQCFFHGWGVAKDQKMAVSYYQVAARLGDPDAQQELGYCLANGKGCKKDRKEAAKWYRAAVAQGASDVGMAWIYKEKFQ